MHLKKYNDFLNEQKDKKVNHIEKQEISDGSDSDLEKEVEDFMSSESMNCPRCRENYDDCVCLEEDPWSTVVYHRATGLKENNKMYKKYLNTYTEFLNEAKNNSSVKIVVLSNKSPKSYTLPELKKELNRRGIPNVIINITTCKLVFKNDGSGDVLISDDETKPFLINPDDTAILTRRGVVRNTVTRDVVTKLEDNNFFVVNTIKSIMTCENKFTTSKILMDAGIPVPKMALIENSEMIEHAVKEVGGQFPVILKLLSGSQGIGVSIVESLASLKSVLQTMWKVDPDVEVMIQEKIDADNDLRIHVLTKKFNSPHPNDDDAIILGSMKRNKVDKDFRTNHSLGGTVEKIKITPEQEKISIDSARAVGCNWCGVDLMVDKKTGKNYVLEVNASPGTQGLKKATGINVVTDIIDFIINKNNWVRSRVIVGFRELVNIPGVGSMVVKFDTGNGATSCSMTYDDMKIDKEKKMVNWKIKDYEFTNPLIGYSKPLVGDKFHERPIIKIDIEFAGKIYKEVEVSLVNRVDKTTPFLANRKFMEMIGCSVNPSKTFILTEMPKDYSVYESPGDPYGGIKFEKTKK
jgi:ribosomal protein S6--L-glutamate ligase